MNENKTTQIKNIVVKIDLDKINSYLQENSTSRNLKEIAKHTKKALESNEKEKVFKLGTELAYDLDTLANKTSYVKDEEEKKY